MFWKTYRTVLTAATGLLTLVLYEYWGRSTGVEALAFVFAAVVSISAEGLQRWANVKIGYVRELADPRSKMTGPWIQKCIRNYGENKPPRVMFSIFYVGFSGKYEVSGTAYDENARRSAEWHSVAEPTIGADGRSMSFVWTGTRHFVGSSTHRVPEDDERRGLTEMALNAGTYDFGQGRVENVNELVSFKFEAYRVTKKFLRQNGLDSEFAVTTIIDKRDAFAKAYVDIGPEFPCDDAPLVGPRGKDDLEAVIRRLALLEGLRDESLLTEEEFEVKRKGLIADL